MNALNDVSGQKQVSVPGAWRATADVAGGDGAFGWADDDSATRRRLAIGPMADSYAGYGCYRIIPRHG